jgi:putative ABC transport system ATP-binding protein
MLLKLQSVTKIYITDEVETLALNGISFEIDRGEYVSIEGPSGCGKSTLLSILGLLDTPKSGRYELNGTDVTNLSPGDMARIRNREIGFIFQNFNLIGELSVQANVELPLLYRGLSKTERQLRTAEVLQQVGMTHRANHYPAQLSGGQQQRVAVARALAGRPSLLLADEPTGNLDSQNGEAVMELLGQLHQAGATIVMVTHDRRYAAQAPRRIGLLDGKIVAAPERAEARL